MNTRIWILFAALAVFAVPAFGQRYYEMPYLSDEGWSGESSLEQGQYLDNPCTAVYDAAWVNYSAYVEGAQTEAGVSRYVFNESTTMGGLYSASGASQSDVQYSGTFAVRTYHKVNTSDNFHVVTVFDFNPGSQTTTLTIETACGNGRPDSPQ